MIPLSIILVEYSDPAPRDRIKTKDRIIIAPKNENAGTVKILYAAKPVAIAIAAPTLAPPLIPSINGSASGFRKTAWYATPESAKAAPTVNAVSSLKNLNSIRMFELPFSLKKLIGLRNVPPKVIHVTNVIGRRSNIMVNSILFFILVSLFEFFENL